VATRRAAHGAPPARLIRLAVRCPTGLAERVLGELVVMAPNGFEEETGEGWVEYAIYGPPGELPSLGEIQAAAGDGLVEVSTTEIPDDWADRWRDFHEAVVVGGRLTVSPSWLDPAAPGRIPTSPGSPLAGARSEEAAGIRVVVDPGQAFGTGAHATTRMCLELLLELADRGEASGALTDLGTGSGVLAIAAAKLGWGPVSGVDYEAPALEAATENAAANGVELATRRVNLREELPELAPTVAANLTAPLLREVAGRLVEPPRRLICSGMLGGEVGDVASAFSESGLEVRERRNSGDWSALLAEGSR
jgi:ribosomal protein L11 methyltransferase